MNQEARELKAFLDKIQQNPRDLSARKVFADWLSQHDEPEMEAEQRAFCLQKYDAEVWLKEFCSHYDADYESLIQGAVSGEGYCFGTTSVDPDDEFWDNIEIVAEKEMSRRHRENTYFSCAC